MKYVILKLLNERPMHGYEIMRELEDRMHGCYSPSPGTVYPTLQWLEDEGLVRGKEVEGKKVYEITDRGREFLGRHRDTVDEIFDRIKETIDWVAARSTSEVHRAMGHLARGAYRAAWRFGDSEEKRRSLIDILERAARQIEALDS
jgi:DNA-binding PadR family transcriptional regulator